MYNVINISTGTVVIRFGTKDSADYWVEVNNTDETGQYMELYKVVKEKKPQ